MRFPAVWMIARHYCWDQAQTDELLTAVGAMHFTGPKWLEHEPGAAVVIPARYYCQPGDVEDLNRHIAGLDWVLAILTSDEESCFPVEQLRHPRMHTWVMTPQPGRHKGSRFLGHGPPPDTRREFGHLTGPTDQPIRDWFFAGQISHPRRHQAADAMRHLPGGDFVPTPGFTQGLDQVKYRHLMSMAKVLPCPSGPYTPDSFRLWEALEAGAVPVADGLSPVMGPGYWQHLFGQDPPFPVIENWADFPAYLYDALAEWPANANRIGAWYLNYLRNLHSRFRNDLIDLAGGEWATQDITVLMPTSSSPLHPSTDMVEETIASVRHHLPRAEILLLCDGIRRDQEHRRQDYEEYLRRVNWLCKHRWTGVTPIRFDTHRHQVAMCREALNTVDTPLILFVEHDTPLVTDEIIDWDACTDAILDGELNTIRFHYESVIPEPHKRLMLDEHPVPIGRLTVFRTRQWSSRPHLSATDYFRSLLHDHFSPNARSFVEDRIHGVIQDEQWEDHRLAIYAEPDGYVKRSVNLDGRRDDPKADCRF